MQSHGMSSPIDSREHLASLCIMVKYFSKPFLCNLFVSTIFEICIMFSNLFYQIYWILQFELNTGFYSIS